MMNFKKLVVICIGLLFVVSDANVVFAQTDEGKSGTVYSSYGTGMPVLSNTAQERAMGIPGVSFNDLRAPGLSNPAFWGFGSYSRVAANVDFNSYSIKDVNGTGENSLLQIASFQALFPLLKNKLGLSVALYPETRSSYNVNSNQKVLFGDSELTYLSNRTGTGGVSKFEVGLGFKLMNNVSIGYAPAFAFLTEKDTEFVSFTNANINSNLVTRKTSGTSVSHRFGSLIVLNKLFKENDILQLGATINIPTEFSAKRKSETRKKVGNIEEVVTVGTEEQADVSLPLKYGVGLTYFPNQKFNVSAEVMNEKWTDAKYGLTPAEENTFKDRTLYGVGAQFHPYKSRSRKFLSNFKYSLGMSYDTGHLEINNQEINTLWFSAGLGLISPNLRSSSSFDISFQYGIRGTTDQNLVQENIFGINLSVNLTELMFLQRKLN